MTAAKSKAKARGRSGRGSQMTVDVESLRVLAGQLKAITSELEEIIREANEWNCQQIQVTNLTTGIIGLTNLARIVGSAKAYLLSVAAQRAFVKDLGPSATRRINPALAGQNASQTGLTESNESDNNKTDERAKDCAVEE